MPFVWRVLRVRAGETAPLCLSAAFHFFLLASYYILRAVRDEIGATHADVLSVLWTLVFLIVLAVVPLFWMVISVWPRRIALPAVYLFFVSNILLFHPLLRLPPGPGLTLAERAFYVWTSVFALVAVSVFWALMADVYSNEQGKRLFGIVAAGGSLGGIAGPAVTTVLLASLDRQDLVLVAATLLAAGTGCLWRLNALFARPRQETPTAIADHDACRGTRLSGGLLDGLATVVRSRYMLGICAFLFLHSLGSTFLYYEKLHLVRSEIVDRSQRTAFFAEVDLVVNTVTVLFQGLFLSRLIGRVGVGVTLLARPAITVIGFAALAVALAGTSGASEHRASVVFAVLVTFEVLRRAVNFSLAKPAREILFTVVDRETKYKSKSFIDTVVYRGSDLVHGWFFEALQKLGLGLAAIAAIAAPLAAVGVLIALALGRRQEKMAALQANTPKGTNEPLDAGSP